MSDIAVRIATSEDVDGLIEHCRLLHGENGLFSLSYRKVAYLLDKAFQQEGAIIGVIGDEGLPESSIYLDISQPYYSDDWQIIELWNFVMPPRQKRAGHARALLQFAKHCSVEMHIPLLVGIMTNHRTEAKTRLYERQLEKAGVYFMHGRNTLTPGAWDK